MEDEPFFRLTIEDGRDIAFVLSALICEAIDVGELREWACLVIEKNNDPPLYVFDYLEFSGSRGDAFLVPGFAPIWPDELGDSDALYGIVYLRGIRPYQPRIMKMQAIKFLADNPFVEDRFRKMFPFIVLP